MTGRELILYILENGLENEPVFENDSFIGFMTVADAAKRLNVGRATIYALISEGKLDYIILDEVYLISANSKLISDRTNAQTA